MKTSNKTKKSAVSAVAKSKAVAAKRAHKKTPAKPLPVPVVAPVKTKAAALPIYPSHVQELLDKTNAKTVQKSADTADLSGTLPITL